MARFSNHVSKIFMVADPNVDVGPKWLNVESQGLRKEYKLEGTCISYQAVQQFLQVIP